MNRSEMIAILAEKVGFSRKDIEHILDEMNTVTVEALAQGDKVAFSGFGSFEVRTRAAHTGARSANGRADRRGGNANRGLPSRQGPESGHYKIRCVLINI